ncbi:hypothetical protein L1987_74159 [Smallanthus sonchifolius]|uniref:Uncharacterized protein n=1 Tax=Smallanthus sonchifolius TaxID=185202 RepID=A0ACB9A6D3_9ASTR|nr:hypothetical protein L1987_74159 [Smallanthus sonchifolius]
MEGGERSEMEFTDLHVAADSIDASVMFHLVMDILGFALFMHQQREMRNASYMITPYNISCGSSLLSVNVINGSKFYIRINPKGDGAKWASHSWSRNFFSTPFSICRIEKGIENGSATSNGLGAGIHK